MKTLFPLLLAVSALWTTPATADSSCLTAQHPDFVPHLPGFDQPLPSPWFSGYLTYELEGRTVHTHYVLIQAEEDFNETKPVIYWTNGGPGASSLFGLLTELGPLLLDDRSLQTDEYAATGIPTLLYNTNAWTRLGHLLIIDQPAPVGFSYCNDDKAGHSCADLSWTDELAAANAHAAMQQFYAAKFPCLAQKDLYLTGESYAGIYVPTLAREIVKHHGVNVGQGAAAAPDASFGTLRGFAVGDGCLGTETEVCRDLSADSDEVDMWAVLFMAGHGQIPLTTYREVMRACHVMLQQDDATGDSLEKPAASPECQASLQKVKKQVGGFYGYSLYDDCTYRNGLKSSPSRVGGAVNDYSCGGDIVMQQYIHGPQVQEALHVASEFFAVDNADGFDYTPTEKDLSGFYKEINGALRVLVYNGDADPAITSFAAQSWTSKLGFTETEEWRPWTVDGCRRMGGYVTRYEGEFDFLTIRGAGHMVPSYKPAATFTFLKAWLEETDYPEYDETCEIPSFVETETMMMQ